MSNSSITSTEGNNSSTPLKGLKKSRIQANSKSFLPKCFQITSGFVLAKKFLGFRCTLIFPLFPFVKQLKVAALQNLVKIMSLYYQYMEEYMGRALFPVSLPGLNTCVNTGSISQEI